VQFKAHHYAGMIVIPYYYIRQVNEVKLANILFSLLSVASRLAESGPYCHSWMSGCLSACHPTAYSLPRLTDHNQIWYAGTYLSSHPCKPFWIPCLPYSRFQMEKYGKFRLFRTLNGYHFDIRTQIIKSRRESMRMSMDSIVPKY